MTKTQYKILGTLLLVVGMILSSFDFNASKLIAGIFIGVGFACVAFQKISLKKL